MDPTTLEDLPQELCAQILSYLSTEEAVRYSLLLTKEQTWPTLYQHTSRLEFSFCIDYIKEESFVQFVNTVIALRNPGVPLRSFSLSLVSELDEDTHADPWINYALQQPSLDELELCFYEPHRPGYELPAAVFLKPTLVKLEIASSGDYIIPDEVACYLPSLKTLHLNYVSCGPDEFASLIQGSPVLEELVLHDFSWFRWDSCLVSSTSLKKLVMVWTYIEDEEDRFRGPLSVSFNTPSLVYLCYTDDIAGQYPLMDVGSLVQAHIKLHRRVAVTDQDEDEVEDIVIGDATDFIVGIRMVQELILCAETLEVLKEIQIPLFEKVTTLEIESESEFSWDSLPQLLNNCISLQKLVFHDVFHRETDGCGDVCPCKNRAVPSSLVESRVRVLVISDCGNLAEDETRFYLQITHFLERMACLKELVLCGEESSIKALYGIAAMLATFQPKASPHCVISVVVKS